MTMYEYLLQQGEARALLRQLQSKFRNVSDDVKARVSQASATELTRWTKRILTATTIDEVFGKRKKAPSSARAAARSTAG